MPVSLPRSRADVTTRVAAHARSKDDAASLDGLLEGKSGAVLYRDELVAVAVKRRRRARGGRDAATAETRQQVARTRLVCLTALAVYAPEPHDLLAARSAS